MYICYSYPVRHTFHMIIIISLFQDLFFLGFSFAGQCLQVNSTLKQNYTKVKEGEDGESEEAEEELVRSWILTSHQLLKVIP